MKEAAPKGWKSTIDEFVACLKETWGMGGVSRRYELASDEDRRKIEEAVVYCLHKFNLHPTELHKIVLDDLHAIIEERWKASMDREKEPRIRALLEIQNHLTLDEATQQAELNKQNFLLKKRIGLLMIGETEKVHDEGIAIWTKFLQTQQQA